MSSSQTSTKHQESVALLDPSLLSRIKDYQLLARIAADGFLSGAHRSLTSGQGTEFLQYREYAKGEDLKFVDWKYFARTDKLQTKRYAEHTQASCFLLIDTSASMGYKGDRSACHKLRYTCMLAATIAWLAIHQGDKVGLITYSDKIHEWIPPASHTNQLKLICQVLYRSKPTGHALHRIAINTILSKLNERGMAVLFSDMIDGEKELPALFRFGSGYTHEGLAIQVLDPDELDFPFTNSMIFEDAESGKQVQTNPIAIRDQYIKRADSLKKEIQSRFNRVQVDFFSTTTDKDLALTLSRYLHRRQVIR